MIEVSTSWLGGSPRVTISRDGDQAVIKLLGVYSLNSTRRQTLSNHCDTRARKVVRLPAEETESILKAALELSRSANKCWVWDSANLGVAELYNHPFDDQISF